MNRLLGTLAVLSLPALFGCSDPDPHAEAIARYLETVEATGASKIADVKSPDDVLTGLIMTVRGEDGCRAAFSDTLGDFAHQIVFGALDGLERATDPDARPFRNASIWGKDASRKLWDASCAEMRQTRERYLECDLKDDTIFLIGVFTLAHYEEREATHGDSYDAARDLMRVGTREHETPKDDCLGA